MALPVQKRRGRYNRYLEEDNPLEKMPRRIQYRYNKALFVTTASSTTVNGSVDGKAQNIIISPIR